MLALHAKTLCNETALQPARAHLRINHWRRAPGATVVCLCVSLALQAAARARAGFCCTRGRAGRAAGCCRRGPAARMDGRRGGRQLVEGGSVPSGPWPRSEPSAQAGARCAAKPRALRPARSLRSSAAGMLKSRQGTAPGASTGRGPIGGSGGARGRSAPDTKPDRGAVTSEPRQQQHLPSVNWRPTPSLGHAGMRRIRGVAGELSRSALAWRPVGMAASRRRAHEATAESEDVAQLRQHREAARRVQETLREMERRFPIAGRDAAGPRLTSERLRALAAPREARASVSGKGAHPAK